MSTENTKEFHYDAFISYRHVDPDRFVAEKLHKELENFKLPKNIEAQLKKKNPEAKTDISRVFRDEEELPLSSSLEDQIVEALKNSDYLIVICSPRLRESQWCRKEIETFISMHGVDRVLAVLVEGEPGDAFPEELLTREKEITDKDGKKTTIKENIEPLAADVRADNDKARLKALNIEKIRLIAAMYGLNYDELKQRHREQQTRKLITLISVVAAVCLLFAGLSTYSAVTFKKQKDEIQAQSVEIQQQANQLRLQSVTLSEKNDKLLEYQSASLAQNSLNCLEEDDRLGAIQNAYWALTEYDGNAMPYSDEARLALTQALDPYDFGTSIKPATTIELRSNVEFMVESPSGEVAAIYDASGTLSFWSMKTGKEVCKALTLSDATLSKYETTFIDERHFVYIDAQILMCADLGTGTTNTYFKPDEFYFNSFTSLLFDQDTGILYATRGKTLYLLNTETGELIDEYKYDDVITFGTVKCVSDNMVVFETGNIDENIVNVIDDSGNLVFSKSIDGGTYKDSVVYDGKLYILYWEDVNADNFLEGAYSRIDGYDINSGANFLNIKDRYVYGVNLYTIEESDGEFLVEVGQFGVAEYDMKTGENRLSDYCNEGILWSEASADFVVFMTQSYEVTNLYKHTTFGSSGYLHCNLERVDMVANIYNGFLMHNKNTNEAIIYKTMSSKDKTTVDKYEAYDCESYYADSAKEKAKELGLENAEFVMGLVYNDDKSLLSVAYGDTHTIIYQTSDMSVIADYKGYSDYEYVYYYCGIDSEGNTYWSSENYGYGISPEGNIISVIFKLIVVRDDKVYMGYKAGDEFDVVPVYTTKDLLEKAEEYLEPDKTEE
ncbi:MAG: toll/interleukin-1 receptor domain-containing protein [Lachnospiraceae bacterium]|nr:toll/interleukin-1 receptor domain-containing protein [Lachnospiraceae bacterium]